MTIKLVFDLMKLEVEFDELTRELKIPVAVIDVPVITEDFEAYLEEAVGERKAKSITRDMLESLQAEMTVCTLVKTFVRAEKPEENGRVRSTT